jgi:hypothetical protein
MKKKAAVTRVVFAEMVRSDRKKSKKAITKKDAQRVYDLRVECKSLERNGDHAKGAKLWNEAWEILNSIGCTGKAYQLATAHYGIRKVR